MWAEHALPRLRSRGLGCGCRRADVPTDGHRRIAGGGDPRRGAAAHGQPGGRDLRTGRGRRRAHQRTVAGDGRGGRRPHGGGARRGGGRDRRRSVSPSTSGPTATRPGPTPSGRDWRTEAGDWPSWSSAHAGRCCALFGDVDWIALAEVASGRRAPATDDEATAHRSRPAGPRARRGGGRAGGPRPRAGRRHGRVRRGRDSRIRAPRDAPGVPRRAAMVGRAPR